MIKNKKGLFIIMLIVCMITMLGLTSCAKDNDDASDPIPFVPTDEVVITHITDTHYFPLNYCFNGNFEGTEYENSLVTGTKLVVESSAINAQAIKDIEKQNPDYLVMTGDNTHDGEIQAHIEIANLLRQLQNNIREKGNSNFQVFVIPGNHDMYNKNAKHFRNNGEITRVEHLTTRYDITKIYSSLGYPDLSNNEIESYYDTLTDVYYDYLPYEGNYINSTTANSIRIEYQYEDNGKLGDVDYDNGDVSYVAYCPNNYVFIGIDEEISNDEVNHHVGGLLYDTTKEYFLNKNADEKFLDKSLIGIMHHNIVPHFELEPTLLKDFTVYGWKESADFFADLGIQYMFTGHMHSNDIATHTSFNGNIITDIETSSTISYKGATRQCKLERGTVGEDYAENFSTQLHLVDATDFTLFFDDGFMDMDYITQNNLAPFITQEQGKYICHDPSEYAVTRVYLNIVDSSKQNFLSPDFIGNAGKIISDMLPDSDGSLMGSMLGSLSGLAEKLVDNIIIHIEEVVLEGYIYGGDNPSHKADVRGAKLCGYLDELVDNLLDIKVNSKGDTLFDFGMGCYLQHMAGLDTSLEDASADNLEALENLKNGSVVKEMLDYLLDDTIGLYPLVEGLTLPIDLAKGMTESEVNSLKGVFNLISDSKFKTDPHAIVLDNHVNKLLSMLDNLGLFSFDLGGATIKGFLDQTLYSFITDSFYTSLGEIAHNILYQFSIDETSKYETSFDEYVTYKYDTSLSSTYLSTAPVEKPSIENGKLPSMLTVSFGEKPKEEKNFVWFTDRRVEGTDIQYMIGDFDATKATKKTGEYALYATTTGSIDLGIFATLMHVEIGYHCIELDSLQTGTTYNYRVGSAADNFWSEVYSFSTAPADNESFELLLMTDIQGSALTTYEQSAEIMNKVEKVFKNGYDFVINCGDVVDNSRNLVQWEYFLDSMQPYWANTTQVVATGNHDKYAYEKVADSKKEYSLSLPNAVIDEYNYYLLHYKVIYPEQDDTSGAYYSFDYSGVHFTVLNTNDITDKNAMSQAQIDWLTEDLATTDKKFKVIIMHKGLYTAGAHSKDNDVINIRKQLTPIFASQGVQLVLQGHDHTYSESFYLDKDGKPIKTKSNGKSKIGDEGTLYITLGTMGDKFYNYVENSNVPIEYGQKLHDPSLSHPTFGKLVYDGEDLYYYGYEYNLKSGKITRLRGLLWWHYTLIGAGAVLIISGATVSIILLRKRKIKN